MLNSMFHNTKPSGFYLQLIILDRERLNQLAPHTKGFFLHEDNPAGKQSAQGVCATSVLGVVENLTGHNTEQPGLTSVSSDLQRSLPP